MSVREMETALGAAIVDAAAPVPAGLVSPRGDADPLRLAVYRNNVHVSLVGVLRGRFAVCQQLVGEEFFTAMARLYVADNKPKSAVLLDYGHDFPRFIRDFPAAQAVPYLSDVAALEVAWAQAYNAADAAPLTLASLASLAPEALLASSLPLHPATRIVQSAYPVGTIWAAHQSVPPSAVTARGAQTVLITRPASQVSVTIVSADDAVFLTELSKGHSLAQAVGSIQNSAFDLGGALAGLTGLGAFVGHGETV